MKPIKVTFTLDAEDAKYFRALHRRAKKHANPDDAEKIIRDVRKIIAKVDGMKTVPHFVQEAIATLESLVEMMVDEEYALPTREKKEVVAALAYFAHPDDLIPDNVPALGFLDDAIMIKFVEEELKEEIWGFDKFRTFREGAEVRPWSAVARERLPARLAAYRQKLRTQIAKRKETRHSKRNPSLFLGW